MDSVSEALFWLSALRVRVRKALEEWARGSGSKASYAEVTAALGALENALQEIGDPASRVSVQGPTVLLSSYELSTDTSDPVDPGLLLLRSVGGLEPRLSLLGFVQGRMWPMQPCRTLCRLDSHRQRNSLRLLQR